MAGPATAAHALANSFTAVAIVRAKPPNFPDPTRMIDPTVVNALDLIIVGRILTGRQGFTPASVAEPPEPNRARHARLDARTLGRHAASDRSPEPDPVLPPRHRRAARRGDLPPVSTNLLLPRPIGHSSTSRSRCCDDELDPPWLPLSE